MKAISIIAGGILLGLSPCPQLVCAESPQGVGPNRRADGAASHLEAALLLQTLNADLLSHDSATLTLERWCGAHQLASPTHVTAERVRDAEKSPTADQRQRLHAASTEEVRYRRVKLRTSSVE